MKPAFEPASFITENLRLTPAPGVAEISLFTAHPGSGLMRLADDDDGDDEPPYWAYPWGGGLVLARYILDHPEIVQGKRVLDLGCGGGIVAIAAAKAGATHVLAADIDPMALAALALNASANQVTIEGVCADLTQAAAPNVALMLIGDLFFDAGLARRVGVFADRVVAHGIEVLVGDPGRTTLPRRRMTAIARYDAADFATARTPAEVFRWKLRAPVS